MIRLSGLLCGIAATTPGRASRAPSWGRSNPHRSGPLRAVTLYGQEVLRVFVSIPALILASAASYSVAMIAMKLWGLHGATPVIVAVAVAALLLAGGIEILALREERLGMIYVGILGAECILIAAASFWLFGESFTSREIAGAALIVAGTALAWA